MGYNSPEDVAEDLYPRGLRKTLAMVLFFVTTTMPTVFLWQNPPRNVQPLGVVGFQQSFGPQRGPYTPKFGPPNFPRSFGPTLATPPPARSTWNWLSYPVQLCLATVGGALALALYCPRSGFKRFALLCGPLVGFGTMFALGLYLNARTEVYRFEIVFASLFGAMPGLLLYLTLVYWKANRQYQYAPLQAIEPVATYPHQAEFPQQPQQTPPSIYSPKSIYPPTQ